MFPPCFFVGSVKIALNVNMTHMDELIKSLRVGARYFASIGALGISAFLREEANMLSSGEKSPKSHIRFFWESYEDPLQVRPTGSDRRLKAPPKKPEQTPERPNQTPL